jgi:hypothetical protein
MWDLKNGGNIICQKDKHKRQHYCFCAIVQSHNCNHLEVDEASLVPGRLCPQKPGEHIGCYYKLFNRNNYMKW